MNYRNLLSYENVLRDIDGFRNGTHAAKGYEFEDPTTFYFKLFFYFVNDPLSEEQGNLGRGSNLLGIPKGGNIPGMEWKWTTSGDKNDEDKFVQGTNPQEVIRSYAKNYDNTALGYLHSTGMDAQYLALRQFIYLLSHISCDTPWVFQEITGLKDVLTSNFDPKKGISIGDEEKQIVIKCLSETYDMRLTTMMNMYRNAAYDRVSKLVILPENLRKFDMGIYVFPAPMFHMRRYSVGHDITGAEIGSVADSVDSYLIGSRYIELLDCEFDIGNGFDALDNLNMADGKKLDYELKINVGQAYEMNYNEFLDETFGDVVGSNNSVISPIHNGKSDKENRTTINNVYTKEVYNPETRSESVQALNKKWGGAIEDLTNKVMSGYPGQQPADERGLMGRMFGQAIGFAKSKATNFMHKLVLGNLYGLSPKNIADNILSGNIGIQTIGQVREKGTSMGIFKNGLKNSNLYENVVQGTNEAIRTGLGAHKKQEKPKKLGKMNVPNAESFGFTVESLKDKKMDGYE